MIWDIMIRYTAIIIGGTIVVVTLGIAVFFLLEDVIEERHKERKRLKKNGDKT